MGNKRIIDLTPTAVPDQITLLTMAEDSPPGDAIETVANQLLMSVGATELVFLIADLSGQRLVRISAAPKDEHADIISIHDTPEGIALRRQTSHVITDGNVTSIYAPVTSRGDAIGVLAMKLPQKPTSDTIAKVDAAGHTLAYILIANRRHTDLYEWGQRSGPMTLAAEIQRRIIPNAFTCEAGWFTVAGWLEPSMDVAGDTFDYSFDRSHLTLSLTDAMGHSIDRLCWQRLRLQRCETADEQAEI